MLNCFLTHSVEKTLPIIPVYQVDFDKWLAKQFNYVQSWVKVTNFTAKAGSVCLVPDKHGNLERILIGVEDVNDFWMIGTLPGQLSPGNYKLSAPGWSADQLLRAAIAWGLGSYIFDKYKKSEPIKTKLVFPEGVDQKYLNNVVEAIYLVRNLVNTSAEDLGPEELAQVAAELAQKHGAKFTEIVGEKLLKENYPAIYAVGKGSVRAPRLIDIKWGKAKAPKITLVGKGVCFDSGGLCLKPSTHMRGMKKDMAGAAHALGLASMIMQANLPVNLHVLIPAVENLISGCSYKVDDIIVMRSGKSVEVANTDAEGRLILGDALNLANDDKPDLLMDFASLTGAARVALGMDITAMFTDNDELANNLSLATQKEKEPLWRMPLYSPYREYLDSKIADICNISSSQYGGAVTAALFLQEFVADKNSWVHFDLAAWNEKTKPGHPEGGEAYCLRGIFNYLCSRFGQK